LSFSADSRWLAVGTESGCYVFAAETGQLRWRREPPKGEALSFWETAFSPDGSLIAWTPKPSQVQLLNASDGSEIVTLDFPTHRYITRLTFSPDGRWLAETSNKHVLHLWDIQELRRKLAVYGLDW
jgi:WD40 repeat protein